MYVCACVHVVTTSFPTDGTGNNVPCPWPGVVVPGFVPQSRSVAPVCRECA